MGNKTFTLCEDENSWRGFIYDLDCKDSFAVGKILIPGYSTAKRTDAETVIEAREQKKTVVTSNGSDFMKFTIECQRRDNRNCCEDCWGLVVVPNMELDRERSLRKAAIKNGISIGGGMLPWKAVGYANLCINVSREGEVRVRRFERCQFCERTHPLMDQQWYKDLLIVQAASRPKKRNTN